MDRNTAFTENSSYAITPNYARLCDKGLQRIFVCRVVVGEFCRGVSGAPAPSVRHGLQLFDSTVDIGSDPEIYVTYHDAQAYPEYMVTLRQVREAPPA